MIMNRPTYPSKYFFSIVIHWNGGKGGSAKNVIVSPFILGNSPIIGEIIVVDGFSPLSYKAVTDGTKTIVSSNKRRITIVFIFFILPPLMFDRILTHAYLQ